MPPASFADLLNVEAGEDIWMAERSTRAELEEWTQGFYLLDGGVAVLLRSVREGRLLPAWRTDDPDIVHPCRTICEAALAAAEPRGRYLERTPSGRTRGWGRTPASGLN